YSRRGRTPTGRPRALPPVRRSRVRVPSANQMTDVLRSFDIIRVRGDARSAATDRAATEEPLEIRLHRRPFAVIMRTPGADRELAAGFLLSERVVRSGDDLGTIEYCTDRGEGLEGLDGEGRVENTATAPARPAYPARPA